MENIKQKMERRNINILGICVTRWEKNVDFMSKGQRNIRGPIKKLS